jgi:hypothetical protein
MTTAEINFIKQEKVIRRLLTPKSERNHIANAVWFSEDCDGDMDYYIESPFDHPDRFEKLDDGIGDIAIIHFGPGFDAVRPHDLLIIVDHMLTLQCNTENEELINYYLNKIQKTLVYVSKSQQY